MFWLLVTAGWVWAQDAAGVTPPPKILTITREFLKPGKSGAMHEKTESDFVKAFRDAKWPTTYIGMDSLSGKPRSLFFTGYDSYAAWEKDALAVQKNSALSAAIDRAGVADGELQSDADGGVFEYREELSLRAPVDIAHMRYFEITMIVAKPGHDAELVKLSKMYVAAYEKIPDVHWAAFEAQYGQYGNAYLFISPLKSATEIDAEFGQGKQFEQALGADGMKQLDELAEKSIQSTQTNLFMINPKESYVSDAWIKADPAFWKP
jgi:hypothetical protein